MLRIIVQIVRYRRPSEPYFSREFGVSPTKAVRPSPYIHTKKRSTSALVLIGKPNRFTTRKAWVTLACLFSRASASRASSKSLCRPSTSGRYRFRDRSKSPCWASRQISAQMACPLAWATGSSKRPRRLMK